MEIFVKPFHLAHLNTNSPEKKRKSGLKKKAAFKFKLFSKKD